MSKDIVVPLLLNGVEVFTSDKLVYNVYSPFTENLILYKAQGASLEDIDKVTESSFQAFQCWMQLSYEKRRDVLNKVAAALEKEREYFFNMLLEMGVSPQFANFNIETGINIIKESAALTSTPIGSIPQSYGGSYSLVVREPCGPVLSIVPWNAPIILCIRAIVSPLAAGCSVLLKTSEQSPMIHHELAKLFLKAGGPPGLVNTVHHSSEDAPNIITALVNSPRIKKINFTGSSNVGKIISNLAAKVSKPILLELGGKCAAIVTLTADIDRAATEILRGAWAHNGQICMSTERVFVENEIYDSFLEKLAKRANKIAVDNAGIPQRSVLQAEKITALVKDAIERGAKCFFGNTSRSGAYLLPIILTEVNETHQIFDVETFGPVLYVSKVADYKEAIEKVNSSEYGLSCAIWSKDTLTAIEIARNIESGAVHINGSTIHDEPTLPHGGQKGSGSGRFNGTWGIEEFQYVKTITISK
ncbi:uncharacterized protein PRCAT00005090001 [Priceomyces carsonii]|uniref:uncharacterized protein n=1 Tax=Priceomyces carsonii TaxID=28549 RepID=UPI002ED8EF33|nr:unnamed protein product [Priceomyces carsonii]